MRSMFTNFKKDEDGAVTVDWVVLTGAIVGLGIAVIASVSGGARDTASGLGANLGARSITIPG